MKTYVLTTFSEDGFNLYGKRMINTFLKFWPKDVEIIVYTDVPIPLKNPRIHNLLISSIPEIASFRKRHENNAESKGLKPNQNWPNKALLEKYNYKYDAYRFCFQAIVLFPAAQYISSDAIMIWLDADVYTFKEITTDYLNELLPENYDCSYLGRTKLHSECGWMAFRLPKCNYFLSNMLDNYNMGLCFSEKDGSVPPYIFDSYRGDYEKEGLLKFLNLAEDDISTGHVWFSSPLGQRMDHLKGNYKTQKYSKERFMKHGVSEEIYAKRIHKRKLKERKSL